MYLQEQMYIHLRMSAIRFHSIQHQQCLYKIFNNTIKNERIVD